MKKDKLTGLLIQSDVEPDLSGNVYTREAIEKAIEKADGKELPVTQGFGGPQIGKATIKNQDGDYVADIEVES